jgi:sortase A
MYNAKLFTDLTELEEGDCFYLHVLNKILAYQVDQILIVEPNNIDSLKRVPGKDYCTLITCTPYGVNSHRLLVRGKRIAYKEKNKKEENDSQTMMTKEQKILLIVALVTTAIMVALIIITIVLKNKKRKNVGS